jgi:hypothetical protein
VSAAISSRGTGIVANLLIERKCIRYACPGPLDTWQLPVVRLFCWRIVQQRSSEGWGVRPHSGGPVQIKIAKGPRQIEEAGEVVCGEHGIIIAELTGMKLKRLILSLALLGVVVGVSRCHHPTPSVADVEVVPGVVGERDQALMRDVVAAFDQADALLCERL